ncbi:hypothetical protein COBT_003382, partial [Conglomerata obtusa]
MPAKDGGLGLIMAIKNNSGLILNPYELMSDYIISELKSNKKKVILGNIYCSNQLPRARQTLKKVEELFKENSSKDVILVGDWNKTPEELINKLVKKGVQVFPTCVPTNGTRICVNRRTTNRAVDYAISNNSTLISEQKVKKSWRMSDHYPVIVKIQLQNNLIEKQKTTILNRYKLEDPKIKDQLKNLHIDFAEKNILNFVTNFHELVDTKLRALNVLKEEFVKEQEIFIPESVKKAIKLKRSTDKNVSNGLATLEDLNSAQKAVKKAIALAKRKKYLKYIKKGIDFLKTRNSKQSWKWVKNHIGRAKNSQTLGILNKPGTTTPETDQEKNLELWSNHFAALCNAPNEVKNYSINNTVKRFANITDRPISWTEIKLVLKKIRKNKASGIDRIPGEIYKIVEKEEFPSCDLSKSILKILNGVF